MLPKRRFDTLIIGAGGGGLRAALQLSHADAHVAVRGRPLHADTPGVRALADVVVDLWPEADQFVSVQFEDPAAAVTAVTQGANGFRSNCHPSEHSWCVTRAGVSDVIRRPVRKCADPCLRHRRALEVGLGLRNMSD